MKEQSFEGLVGNVIYHNKENGYTVFELEAEIENSKNTKSKKSSRSESEDEDVLITCIAYLPSLSEGENIRVTGSFVVHPTYGKQLSVSSYEKIVPTSLKGIEKYLGSGAIKGVRERLAGKIVKKFGLKTMEVLEEKPERLTEIPGISLDRALSIGQTIHDQSIMRRVMIFLQQYSITPAYSMKIYKKYKEAAIDIVKENPYRLADDIRGIGFKTADGIARNLGMELSSSHRIRAGIKYCLTHATTNGHVFLPQQILIGSAADLLEIPAELVEENLAEMQIVNELSREQTEDGIAVYLNFFHYAENYIAKKLIELSAFSVGAPDGLEDQMARFEAGNGLSLAENQKLASIKAMESGVLVITGGPGTGKTTTINAIINILKGEKKIELAAPTGRAAKRMSEATGRDARTIHRLLEISFLDDNSNVQSYGRNEDRPLEADLIIIDESSMVDIPLMFSLLKAIPPGARLVLAGDMDQLPSVGPGNVLRDIISSGLINVVRLNEIFRQAQESAIVMNAHRINNGQYPVLNEKNKDFFFVKRGNIDDVVTAILDLVLNRLPKYANCDAIQDIQVLTPMRKSLIGVENLNHALQAVLNPPSPGKKEKAMRLNIFREGDKVMQIKNNYNLSWIIRDKSGARIDEGLGVFNGDTGIIRRINEDDEIIGVMFDDDKYVEYDFTLIDELELAYAITIHKSQGSEYKVIIMPAHSGPQMLLNRNLLYTGITRARKLAVIVGLPEALNRMVDNNKQVARFSMLGERIRKYGALLSDTK